MGERQARQTADAAPRFKECLPITRGHALVPVSLALLLLAARPNPADERLKDVACRSVHLHFPAPEGTAFYNEVTVEKSSDGTYFCVCGFSRGYFGLQELADGKKLLIFSVWDPGKQDNPNAVPQDQRVQLRYHDDRVRVGRFGNEGTGGQSFFDYEWKPGVTYRLMVTARVDGDRTAVPGISSFPKPRAWKRLVTFSTLAGGKPLGGYYSFIEDFRRNRVSATRQRQAALRERAGSGPQTALDPAGAGSLHGGPEPGNDINARVDDARFFLATGGDTRNTDIPLSQNASSKGRYGAGPL